VILDEGHIGQSRTAEPGPQLELLLQCLPVLLVGRIFNGDAVVTLADFTVLLGLALALLWNIYKSRRGSWVGDKLRKVILQQTVWVSTATTIQSVLKDKFDYQPCLADEPQSTRGMGRVCMAAYP
jgi:hypothetical protein